MWVIDRTVAGRRWETSGGAAPRKGDSADPCSATFAILLG
jgi:hypothetical protein